jgi:adenylate kinase family enzyme
LYRVLVIGCFGSGKSTVARELAKITGLPAVHLDQHYWRPDWTEPDKALWSVEIASLVAQPRWIMDGNYSSTLAARLSRADTVVFLDMPTMLCLWRVLCRTLRYIGRTRDDMAKGCLERFDWPFLKYVYSYRRDRRPQVLKALDGFTGTVVILGNPSAVAGYLTGMRQERLTAA